MLDGEGAIAENAARASGHRHSYAPAKVQQTYGHLQRLIVLPGASRQSRTLSMRIAVSDAMEWSHEQFGSITYGRVCDDSVQPAVADFVVDLTVEEDVPSDIERQADVDDDERLLSELWPEFFVGV